MRDRAIVDDVPPSRSQEKSNGESTRGMRSNEQKKEKNEQKTTGQ